MESYNILIIYERERGREEEKEKTGYKRVIKKDMRDRTNKWERGREKEKLIIYM